ncbi:MAG: NAD-binding protein, partial [Candidatus Dormibacteria bacterium]
VRAGVSLERLVEVIGVSSGGSTQLDAQLARRALVGHFEPGFKTSLLVKDMRLAAALADRLGQATPVVDAARARFEALLASHPDRDYSALLLEMEREAGVELRLP